MGNYDPSMWESYETKEDIETSMVRIRAMYLDLLLRKRV